VISSELSKTTNPEHRNFHGVKEDEVVKPLLGNAADESLGVVPQRLHDFGVRKQPKSEIRTTAARVFARPSDFGLLSALGFGLRISTPPQPHSETIIPMVHIAEAHEAHLRQEECRSCSWRLGIRCPHRVS